MAKKPLIGFIGQGFIGKSYADDFESRGYSVVRYTRHEPFVSNKEKIKDCDIVFVAIPTPTTPKGFNYDGLKEVIPLVGIGKTVVIKSTMLPGTCEILQKKYPDRFVFHSPEFLTEAKAAYDAAHPTRNIVGTPVDNKEYRQKAEAVLAVLPKSPLSMVCSAKEAEFIKYASNCFLTLKVIYANVLYDMAVKDGSNWENIAKGMGADPRIGPSHLHPAHASGHTDKVGRGAGGHCFIKDFAALIEYSKKQGGDPLGLKFLQAAEKKNIDLLLKSEKDLDLLEGVYGKSITN